MSYRRSSLTAEKDNRFVANQPLAVNETRGREGEGTLGSVDVVRYRLFVVSVRFFLTRYLFHKDIDEPADYTHRFSLKKGETSDGPLSQNVRSAHQL